MTLLAAGVVLSLTPGAGAVNAMSNSLVVGWRRSIWGVLGQQIALVLYIAVAATGLGVLIANSPTAFNTMRYLGAAYLVWLGIRQWRSSVGTSADDAHGVAYTNLAMLRRGLFVNLTNPKAIIFFLALMPQFIDVDRPLPQQYLVIAVTLVAIDIAVMWGVFAGAARALRQLTRSESGQLALRRVFGTLFVVVGVGLALSH
jgi:homoserine/homoserine lactone efflux protein